MNFPYPCLCSSASLLKLSMNMHFSIKPCWVFLHIGSSKYFSRDIYGFLRRVCLLLLVSPKLFVGHAEHELPLSQSANMMMAAWMTSLQPEAFSTDFVVLLDVFLPHEHCNKQRTLSWKQVLFFLLNQDRNSNLGFLLITKDPSHISLLHESHWGSRLIMLFSV